LHNTVREHLEFLSDIYMIGVANVATSYKPQPRREKRIFFRNPLIYRAFAHWASKKIDESALLEHVVLYTYTGNSARCTTIVTRQKSTQSPDPTRWR
jgi:predicted AAA+ superfamily ATPase